MTSEAYRASAVPIVSRRRRLCLSRSELKRLTAEQFVDAVWMLTGTAPQSRWPQLRFHHLRIRPRQATLHPCDPHEHDASAMHC